MQIFHELKFFILIICILSCQVESFINSNDAEDVNNNIWSLTDQYNR
jgi:hypothetical protein